MILYTCTLNHKQCREIKNCGLYKQFGLQAHVYLCFCLFLLSQFPVKGISHHVGSLHNTMEVATVYRVFLNVCDVLWSVCVLGYVFIFVCIYRCQVIMTAALEQKSQICFIPFVYSCSLFLCFSHLFNLALSVSLSFYSSLSAYFPCCIDILN